VKRLGYLFDDRGSIPGRVKIFIFAIVSKTDLNPTQPLTQTVGPTEGSLTSKKETGFRKETD
jgi:hypothetical protein